MDSRTQERVEQWDSRPFTGGYNELSTLADNDFSGVVTAGGTWLFMLNGRVIGVVDGEITAFEQASGTIYAAPHASLPLLCSMQAQGGDVRANYYTNETPLSEVDQTLKDGSFTGYIELSEQVLSGDYYAVYYGGRRMAAAYIGNAQRLLTGEEAFERAADEVGIYEVVDVEINVTNVPEGSDQSPPSDNSQEETAPAATGSATPTDEDPSTTADATPTARNADGEPAADESSSLQGTDPSAHSSAAADSQEAARPASASELREVSDLTDLDDESDSAASSPSPESDGEPSSDETGSATVSYTDSSEESVTAEATTDSSETEPATDRAGTSAERGDQHSTQAQPAEPQPQDGPTDAAETAAEPDADPDEPSVGDEGDPQADAGSDQVEQSAQTARAETASHDTPSDSDDESTDPEEDGELDARLKQEERWRETRSIPSIDPENSERVGPVRRQSADPTTDGRRERSETRAQSSETPQQNGTSRDDAAADRSSAETKAASDASSSGRSPTDESTSRSPVEAVGTGNPDAQSPDAAVEEYEQRIEMLTQHARELESRRERLEAQNAELESERDRVQAENQELSATVERLNSRVEELEAECERLREVNTAGSDSTTAGFGESGAGRQLSPREALSETNLFVRYASKSDPTLQTAHDGADEQDAVAANLQIEQHTTFDESNVSVAGRSYEDFLTDTMEYRFVDWLVQTLLFEIRDTGHGDGLADLYDAIPRIDRAELQATISLEDDQSEDVPDEVTFDIVAFDKMGNPLIVANCNDSRDPATEGMLAELEEAASAVTANYPDLGAAIVVTASYFEPGALEVTEQATSSGFLSRGSKLSYVNLSRKQGYHLALVESRSSGFHMNVPEL